jgi:hypothetical protein
MLKGSLMWFLGKMHGISIIKTVTTRYVWDADISAMSRVGVHEIVGRQHMFSVYVHMPPNKTLEGPTTIFTGREIPGSIVAKWGEWSLADASRILLRCGCTSTCHPKESATLLERADFEAMLLRCICRMWLKQHSTRKALLHTCCRV